MRTTAFVGPLLRGKVNHAREPAQAHSAGRKKGPPSRQPFPYDARLKRSDRARPNFRVPTEPRIAQAGKADGHHRPGRGLRNPRTKAELERILASVVKVNRRERTKTSDGDPLV